MFINKRSQVILIPWAFIFLFTILLHIDRKIKYFVIRTLYCDIMFQRSSSWTENCLILYKPLQKFNLDYFVLLIWYYCYNSFRHVSCNIKKKQQKGVWLLWFGLVIFLLFWTIFSIVSAGSVEKSVRCSRWIYSQRLHLSWDCIFSDPWAEFTAWQLLFSTLSVQISRNV